MRKFLAITLGFMVYSTVFAASAEPSQSVSIPEKVSKNILKRYPKAQDMHAANETHFGQKLLEVSFKDEEGQEVLELFTAKGHLFSNEIKVEDLVNILPPIIATLKKEFPGHELQRVELIVNPNGFGEEYEVYLRAADVNWRIAMTDQGVIQDKLKLNP